MMLSFLNRQEKWNTTEDGKRIAEDIKKFGYMETLELQGNTLGVDASVPIAKALEGHPELKRALWSDMFTGRLKFEIPIILKNLCDSMYRSGILLTELDLSDNAIGPMAMPGIEEFLASEACFNLETLRLHNCGMGVAGMNVANCLIECRRKSLEIGKKFLLKTIVIGRNRQEYKGAKGLAKAFKELGTLEEIVMFQNGIRADGIVELSDSFKYNKNLRIINLNDNIFGKKGALAMADALGELQNLEVVDFSDCLCRNKGSYEICKRLKESGSKLREINLSGNEISDNTARQIIKICANIKSLEKLNLGTNCYGGQFDDLVEFASEYNFVDLGEEEDDEGTGDEKEVSEDEDASENSDVESENEDEESLITKANENVTKPCSVGIQGINQITLESKSLSSAPSPSPSQQPAYDKNDPTIQQAMIDQFSQQSGMKHEWARKCLSDHNWDFEAAGKRFLELRNFIPPKAFINPQ